jgi:hypothetical protein
LKRPHTRPAAPRRAARATVLALALAAAATLAEAEEIALPPAPYIAFPPAVTWGQAIDLGHGYLVAAVSPSAVGFAIEGGFPWEELARCAPASTVRDPAMGDATTGVHHLSIETRAGILTVTAETPGNPPLLPGCAARAILAARFDSPASGPAEIALAVVPAPLLRGAPVTALVAIREGSAVERNTIAANVLGAVDYCRERLGAGAKPRPGPAPDPATPRTGRVDLKLVTRDDAILSVTATRSPYVGKTAATCLADAARTPVPSTSKSPKEKATVTVRLIAGGKLPVESPALLADRLLDWSRAVEAMRARGD